MTEMGERPPPASGEGEAEDEETPVEPVANGVEALPGSEEDLSALPLHFTWHLWMIDPKKSTREVQWQDTQKHVHKIETVVEFWRLFNNIWGPSELSLGTDYSLFRDGVLPAWEDAQCEKGGRWVAKLSAPVAFERAWLHLNAAMVAECFAEVPPECICGTVASMRKYGAARKTGGLQQGGQNAIYKLALWIGDSSETAAMYCGRQMRDIIIEALRSIDGEKIDEMRNGFDLTFECFADEKKGERNYTIKTSPDQI